jgi:Glu-tRNA(Gln) amidotransferase subunit E-like FAD-binding protein
MGPLMGEMMKEVRGKIDGAIVSEELKTALTNKLKELR